MTRDAKRWVNTWPTYPKKVLLETARILEERGWNVDNVERAPGPLNLENALDLAVRTVTWDVPWSAYVHAKNLFDEHVEGLGYKTTYFISDWEVRYAQDTRHIVAILRAIAGRVRDMKDVDWGKPETWLPNP